MNATKKRNYAMEGRRPFSTHVRGELLDGFNEISSETGINKTRLTDKAIELLITEFKTKGITLFDGR